MNFLDTTVRRFTISIWLTYLVNILRNNNNLVAYGYIYTQNLDIFNISDCEDIPDKACLHDGDDVLQQYSFGSSHLALDFIALIAQYFLYHGLALLFLQRRASKS